MSTCLNDVRLQAVADSEGTAAEIDHVRTCDACAVRVTNARAAIRDFGRMMSELPVPDMLGSRVAGAAAPRSGDRRGATTLRVAPPGLRARPAWVFAGGAVAAAVTGMLFVVLPSIDPGTTLSAAAILDRSLQALQVHGIERLEYELSLEAPGAVTIENGVYRIEQLIDHDTGRWRFARFGPDGTLLNGISEDPATGIREVLVRLDGRAFRFRFAVPANAHVPLWDVQRRYAESMIRLVQASAAHVVTEESDGDRMRYVVQLRELPTAAPTGGSALFDLARARVVVDAADFHVVEFSAGGMVMGEPLAIGYRLIERFLAAKVTGLDFELPRDDPAAIELQGDGTRHVPGDLLSMLLREVAHSR